MNHQGAFDQEFDQSLDALRSLPLLSRMPRVGVVLDSYPFSHGAKALNSLPFIVHNELSGSCPGAPILGASFMLLNLSSEVLDDVQDRDSDLPWAGWGPADATNVALAMSFQAFELLATLNDAQTPLMIQALAGAGVSAAAGQALQSDRALSMTDWLRQAREKSGVVMAAGALVGAIAATSDEDVRVKARHFGMALGVLSQAVDDVIDLVSADPQRSVAGDNLGAVVAWKRTNGAISLSKHEVASEPVLEATLSIIQKLEADTLRTCQEMPFVSGRLMNHVIDQGASLGRIARASRSSATLPTDAYE